MRLLGLETSCDETAAAVVENGRAVRSNVVASSQRQFADRGGVIPEEAARRQIECVLPVIEKALADAGVLPADVDAIAVTKGPGLLGSLLVGTTTARVCAEIWRKPLIGVHHTLGHLSSVWLDTTPEDGPQFPAIALSASGGHTELWLRTGHAEGRLIGRTRDDAAGEAFDKGATLLGLPYPGGPAIAKAAEAGNPRAFSFPLPLKNDASLDFSFSGLKTALRYTLRDLPGKDVPLADLAASYEHALCGHLIDRLLKAIAAHPDIRDVHLVGGVSANKRLRSELQPTLPEGVKLRTPGSIGYCTDNAAMIAAAGFFLHRAHGEKAEGAFEAEAALPLEAAAAASEMREER
jgi:N6-L-threonylcarbamoyladenine synthase